MALRTDIRYITAAQKKDYSAVALKKEKEIIINNNYDSVFRLNDYIVVRLDKDMSVNKIRKIVP